VTSWIAAKQAEGYGNMHYTMLEGDRVHKAILKFAETFKPDIIIMGTHGTKGMEEFLLGSNAARVVRGARCAVMTVQETWNKKKVERIVMPIDSSLETRQKADETAAVAKATDAHVYVLGVNENDDEFMLNTVNSYVKQVSDYLASVDVEHSIEIRTGKSLNQLVIDFTEEKYADLVIIMTEQESNVLGSFLGTYATRLVNHSKVPVLSVGPKKDMRLFAGTVFSDWSV
jgi:nucleotide-binding universal stress UspA family protein